MSFWDSYKRTERPRLAPGDYRVEIVAAERAKSRSDKEMIVLSIRPNKSAVTIKHYIVEGDWFNANMTEIFDAFGIPDGDFTLPAWVGAVGGARLKEDENGYLKVAWFLAPEKTDKLPPWEGPLPERQTVTAIGGGFAELNDDDDWPL